MWWCAQVSGGVAAQELSFSSYPGELFSDDDMYITSSRMVVLETTNHIYNFTILKVRKQLWSQAGRNQSASQDALLLLLLRPVYPVVQAQAGSHTVQRVLVLLCARSAMAAAMLTAATCTSLPPLPRSHVCRTCPLPVCPAGSACVPPTCWRLMGAAGWRSSSDTTQAPTTTRCVVHAEPGPCCAAH